MPAINFDNFHADLLRTTQSDGNILLDSIMYGAETLREDFTVVTARDKTALLGLDVKDGFKPASDIFDPSEVLAAKSRFVDFKEADIDISFTLSDIKKMYQTYLGWLKTAGRTLAEVNANPFELFFINHIINTHFEFIRLETAWNGVYNAAGSGALSIADGFLTRFTAERGVGGDIKSSHVFDGEPLTVENAYEQINGLAQLVRSEAPKLSKKPLNLYLSAAAYDLYRWNRRTKFKEHVGPADRPTVLDDFSNITFVIDPGLADSDHLSITPKKNLLFVANENPGEFYLNIVKNIKSWDMTIRVSLGFDFATPDWLFLNDQV
jgi:hypothetical protein